MPRRQHNHFATTFALLGIIVLFAMPALASDDGYTPPKLNSDMPVTVSRLIELAQDNQSAYRQSLEDEELIPILKAGAIGQFLPSLSAGASWSSTFTEESVIYIQGTPIDGGKSSSSGWNISANETLFSGLSRFYGYRQAQLNVENTLLNTERSFDLLVSGVKSAVYTVLAAERSLEVEEEILNQRSDVLHLARTRYETGDAIQIDVMQAEIDYGTQENAVLSARQALQNAREYLNLTVGLDLESSYTFAGNLDPELPNINADSLVSIAHSARPDLQQQRNLVEINDYSIKSWNSQYAPSASAFASYSRSGYTQGEQLNWEVMPTDWDVRYGLSLNWTLFDGFSREVQREQAVINKRRSMWDEHQAEQSIAADVRQQWRSLNRLYQQIEVADRNRDLARRQLDLEQERYRVGVSDQINLRSAQVIFVSAEREYLSRVLDFFTTMATLERDLGMPLEEISR